MLIMQRETVSTPFGIPQPLARDFNVPPSDPHKLCRARVSSTTQRSTAGPPGLTRVDFCGLAIQSFADAAGEVPRHIRFLQDSQAALLRVLQECHFGTVSRGKNYRDARLLGAYPSVCFGAVDLRHH